MPGGLSPVLRFGASLGIRNNLLLVGAPGEELDRGASYVFLIGATLDERARLVGAGADAGDGFGESVSFDGENRVVAALGFSAAGKTSAAVKGAVSRADVTLLCLVCHPGHASPELALRNSLNGRCQ